MDDLYAVAFDMTTTDEPRPPRTGAGTPGLRPAARDERGGLWDLAARPDALDAAAHAWPSMGERVDEAATSVNNKASGCSATWEGESATSYDAHRRTLVTVID